METDIKKHIFKPQFFQTLYNMPSIIIIKKSYKEQINIETRERKRKRERGTFLTAEVRGSSSTSTHANNCDEVAHFPFFQFINDKEREREICLICTNP